MLFILVTTVGAIMLGGGAILMHGLLTAKEGYQDANGFHLVENDIYSARRAPARARRSSEAAGWTGDFAAPTVG
jgi:hypothetical protein